MGNMQVEPLEKPYKSSSKSKCFHCNGPILSNSEILWVHKDETHSFCCNGCRTVSEIILESGNLEFYSLRGSQIIEPAEISNSKETIRNDYLNGELVEEEYLREIAPGLYEVFINITNIHCAACVWLNEKVLKETKGIDSIRINFATARAQVQFHKIDIQLSKIFTIIESLGYIPKLHSPWKNQEKSQRNTDLLKRMGLAGFCFGNIMLFGTSLYAGYFTGMDLEWKRLLHYLSWAFASPVYFYSGYPFLLGAWNGLRQKRLSMDFLLVTGISLAYFYSIYVTLSDRGEVYFDSVCMIYFFILLGKYLEDSSRMKSNDKLSQLVSDLPELATILNDEKDESIIRTSEIKKGHTILVRAGERVPTDGILLSPLGYFNEAFLTGESESITKKKTESVLAGSISISLPVEIKAEVDAKNSTLSRLKIIIEQAIGGKPHLERITDRISSYFIAVVFTLAIATFTAWYLISGNIETAIINTISVLIVACPCALGLAVPTALVMNHIRNSREGVIIRNPDSMETLSKVDTIFFDKTGTLTEGEMTIEHSNWKDEDLALAFALAIEKQSNHPIARNLVKEIDKLKKNILNIEIISIEEIPGMGMKAKIIYNLKDYNVQLGSAKYLRIQETSPHTRIHMSWNDEYNGYFELKDSIRSSAKTTIKSLLEITKDIALLSGDSDSVVSSTSRELGLPNYHSEFSPDDKLSMITQIQSQGKIVAMVGDGINDAAALAKANIGISMGIAADLSIDRSDIILVHNDLSSLPRSILYSKETFHLIRQNIGISFIYNSIMLPIAALGWMVPVICAAFMAASSLTVVANSMRLRKREI